MVRRLAGIAAATLLVTCVLDPVADDRSADLGDETPGIERGPLHRAGQPCLACHDEMAVGGTVYGVRGESAPINGASVVFADVNGTSMTTTTNAAGNFFINNSQWQPAYPLHVQVNVGAFQATMSSIIGRDGSCATCHANPASRISAGPVYVAPTAALLPDAGTR